MGTTSIYPVLMSDDVAASAAWFRDHFGFETTFEADWYVSLRRDRWELAVLDASHATIPAGHGRPAAGVLVNLEVDDVDAEWRRLVVEGPLTPLLEVRSEAFGQRHFIVAGPDGVLVDVITEIEPDPSFAEAFEAGAAGPAQPPAVTSPAS
jgi:catechol 2,3-dioxygenase-like lactoylglutathione lyase family enzyme